MHTEQIRMKMKSENGLAWDAFSGTYQMISSPPITTGNERSSCVWATRVAKKQMRVGIKLELAALAAHSL